MPGTTVVTQNNKTKTHKKHKKNSKHTRVCVERQARRTVVLRPADAKAAPRFTTVVLASSSLAAHICVCITAARLRLLPSSPPPPSSADACNALDVGLQSKRLLCCNVQCKSKICARTQAQQEMA
jgi:hypothetical protein